MKMQWKLVVISVCIVTAISCSETLTEHPAIRRLVNKTPYNLQIRIGGSHNLAYELQAHDTIDIDGYCTTGILRYCTLGWFSDTSYAEIIFDEERILVFDDLPDNPDEKSIIADPSREDFGYKRHQLNGIDIFTYHIDEEDYKNAVEISGD